MTMNSLLARLEQIRVNQEAKEIENATPVLIIDVLLDYINNDKIREAVEVIAL